MTEKNKRPDIRPEWSIDEKILQTICFLILAVNVILLIMSWSGLPAGIPTHFNFSGVPDSYGSKSELLVLPIITVALYILITVIERFPKMYNFPFEITEKNASYEYKSARKMLVFMKTEVVASFSYILWASIEIAKGVISGLGNWFSLVFIVIVGGTIGFFYINMIKHKSGE
jgi:uncharacterized membrane protein